MAGDGQYLAQLREYYAKHQVLPSYAGVGELVGLRSKASVSEMIQRLKAEGFLESAPDKRLRPGARFFDRPIADGVQAGRPTAVFDPVVDVVGIDRYLVPNPVCTVLIRVRGDSMINAGIRAGDVVVVEKRNTANVGQIVVAIVENEFTLKRLGREKNGFVLHPENKEFSIIRPTGPLELFGVVVGMFRKY